MGGRATRGRRHGVGVQTRQVGTFCRPKTAAQGLSPGEVVARPTPSVGGMRGLLRRA